MVILTNTKKLKDLKAALMILFPKGIQIISFEAMEKNPTADPEMPLIVQLSLDKPITTEEILKTSRHYRNEEVACVYNNRYPAPFISRDPAAPKIRGMLIFSDIVSVTPEYLATVLAIPLPAPAA